MNPRLVLFVTCACLIGASTGVCDSPQQIFVQVRSSKLRSAPQVYAPATASLRYGDALTVKKESATSGWLEVSTQGKSGFVHISAVTDKRIILSGNANSGSTKLASSDIVLAGKGFNKEVEKQFAAERALDFSKVDRVEAVSVSDQEVGSFLRAGKLGAGK